MVSSIYCLYRSRLQWLFTSDLHLDSTIIDYLISHILSVRLPFCGHRILCILFAFSPDDAMYSVQGDL